MRTFVRLTAPDFALVLVVAATLAFTASFGFESAPHLRATFVVEAALCALVLLPLFAASASKRLLAPGVAAALAISALALAAALALSPEPLFVDGSLNDVAGNYAIFTCCCVVSAAVAFVLSRRSVGVVALLVVALATCGTIQFLFRDWMAAEPGLVAFIVLLAAILTLFIFQTYRSSVRQARRAKHTPFAAVATSAAAIVGACIAAAFLIYYLLVAPLGLGTLHLKPFQEFFQRPVIEFTGVFSEDAVESIDIMTNRVSGDAEDTNSEAAGGSLADEDSTEDANNPLSGIAQKLQDFSESKWAQQFASISYKQVVLAAFSALLLLFLLAALVALALRLWRKRWATALADQPVTQQVETLFTWLELRLARLKIQRQPTQTPLEFALNARHALAPFNQNTNGVDFVRCTLIYQRVIYGSGNVSEDDLEALRGYQQAFRANARAYVGQPKWFFTFWRF